MLWSHLQMDSLTCSEGLDAEDTRYLVVDLINRHALAACGDHLEDSWEGVSTDQVCQIEDSWDGRG